MEKKPLFGLNAAYLYDSNNNFLGTCLDTFDCVTAACFKNSYIMKAKSIAKDYDFERITNKMNGVAKFKDEFCRQYLPYIFLVPKNPKHMFVKENARGKYNHFRLMQTGSDVYNRLVLTDENKFVWLHVIPKGTKLKVTKLSVQEMIDNLSKRVKEPVVHISGFQFAKTLVVGTEKIDATRKRYSSSTELSIKTGWVPSTYKEGECFTISSVREAIKILEKRYSFVHNALYNKIMN